MPRAKARSKRSPDERSVSGIFVFALNPHIAALMRATACAQLRCLARKRNLDEAATKQPDGQINSEFQKSCQAQELKRIKNIPLPAPAKSRA
jgi:hypothetical protein